jgi:thiol-disulfide isomerase/thioredoxin
VTNTGSSTPRALLAGLIVIAAGVAGFVAYRHAGAPPGSDLQALGAGKEPATAAPTPEPATEPEPPAKAIPEKLPDITLANLDGKPTALATFAGRPLLVNFWATWCAPCRREIPLLNKIRMQRQAQNAEIVGIAVDFKDEVLAFVKKTPISYPLLMGEEDGLAAAEAFGMGMGLPFSVFVDSQNRILTIKVGELHEDEANFAFDRLRDIDNGLLTRKAAQELVADAFKEMATERAKAEAAQAEHGPH